MNTQSRVLKWSLIIGIVIVLNLFFNYALSLIYKAPQYEAFCPAQQVNPAIENQDQCLSVGGQWNAYPKTVGPKGEIQPAGYCNVEFTCRQNFDEATKSYNRNVFIVLVVLGAIVVAIGNFFGANAVIANGLSMAGVLSFIIASTRYWSDASDLVRVIILAIALAILFWVAYKKFKNTSTSSV